MMALTESVATAPKNEDKDTVYVERLTKREVQVISRFINPKATRTSVSIELNISESTLNTHLTRIFSKLGSDTIAQAVLRFLCLYPIYRDQLDAYRTGWQLMN